MKTDMRYILMLEDDVDDRHITESFFEEQNYNIGLRFVATPDGLLQYLNDCADEGTLLPSLIILDKYVSIGSSVDTLKLVKSHPVFRHIPIVVVSGSSMPEDIDECYRWGANSYIVKPQRNEHTMRKIGTFVSYWFEVVELPQITAGAAAGSYL